MSIDPLDVFKQRAEARALLWAAGEYDLPTAVDKLQSCAAANGLLLTLGQDAVQQILADMFRPFREKSNV
jgi:hypothetical protein